MVREVLEQVELRDDAGRAIAADRHQGRDAAAQQGERLVERRRRLHQRQRRIHHLADRPFDDGRVAVGAIEQTSLTDRSDEPDDVVALGLLRTGNWLIP